MSNALVRPILWLPIVAGALAAAAMPAAQTLTFDVASVRPSPSAISANIRAMPNGRFAAAGATVDELILRAYGLVGSQLIGTPSWSHDERFDIEARTASAPPGGPDALMPALRALLSERFALRTHRETRDLPAYVLRVARRDGQGGPQLRRTEADCSGASSLTPEEMKSSVRDGWPPCGMAYTVAFATGGANGPNVVKMRVRRSGTTMADFATRLQSTLERPVVDMTGLDGRFDVEYTFAPQPPNMLADSGFGADVPTLFAALDEQLGLRLDSRRTTVPVLVVDSVDRPTAN